MNPNDYKHKQTLTAIRELYPNRTDFDAIALAVCSLVITYKEGEELKHALRISFEWPNA